MEEEKSNKGVLYFILIALFLGLVGLVGAIIVWRYYLNPGITNTIQCSTDNQCSIGTTCSNGTCVDIVCSTDIDCEGSQQCISGFCIEKVCTTNSDCSQYGEACSGGFCVPYGGTCTTSLDCNNGAIGCVGGVCAQCSTSSDCQNGYCSNGLCINSCQGMCSNGDVCVQNKQQVCCSPDPNCGQTCVTQGTGACNYCVNGIYTCKQGETFEGCSADSDCVSGKCFIGSDKGNVCGYVESSECVTNYDPINPTINGSCGSGAPFCSKGTCSTVPLGAPCGSNGNTCRTADLNVSDVTTVTPSPVMYSYYCVEGFCSKTPAQYGQGCSVTDDCIYVQSATNSSVSRLQCINNICQ